MYIPPIDTKIFANLVGDLVPTSPSVVPVNPRIWAYDIYSQPPEDAMFKWNVHDYGTSLERYQAVLYELECQQDLDDLGELHDNQYTEREEDIVLNAKKDKYFKKNDKQPEG